MKFRTMGIAAMMLCLVSCSSTPDPYADLANAPAAKDITRAVGIQEDKAKIVTQNADTTVAASKDIIKTTDEAKGEVTALRPTADKTETPHLDKIDGDLTKIAATANTIKEKAVDTHDAAQTIQNQVVAIRENNKDIVALETKVANLEKENDKIKQDAEKKWYNILVAAGAFGGAMFIGGLLYAFFSPIGKKLGLVVAGSGLLISCIALAATVYFKTIALIGLYLFVAGVITTIGALLYHVLRGNKQIGVLKTAAVENTRVIESIKQELPPETKEEYFGDKAKPGLVHAMQSAETKAIVADIRENVLKKEISSTIPVKPS